MLSSSHHPSIDDPTAWVPYRYHPSLPAAAVAVTLFAITTIAHGWLLFRRRTWYFIPFFIGGIFEVVGYIGRIVAVNDMWSLGPYIVQAVLLLVAPALFAASIYIILGRVILLVRGESCSFVPPSRLTAVFVGGDIISFLLQAGGAGYQSAGTSSSFKLGGDIIIGGLFVQLVFFGVFVLVAISFHVRFRRRCASTPEEVAAAIPGGSRLWQTQMAALYAGSVLILIRSILRVIEYLEGNDGYILRREVFLYIFDGLLMFLVTVIFLWAHPSQITSQMAKRTALESRESSDANGFELKNTRETAPPMFY